MIEPKELVRAKEHLQPNETVIAWSGGLCDCTILGGDSKRHGVVVATEERVFVFVPKLFDNFEFVEFPFSTISSIEHGKGLLGHSVAFIASGNSASITMMTTGDASKLIDYLRGQIGKKRVDRPKCSGCGSYNDADWAFCGNCGAPKENLATPGSNELIEQLERLAVLYSKGLLSPDEFNAAKAKLLW